MSQYYFTVASLPHLTYELEKVPSIEDFLTICEGSMKPGDYQLLVSAGIDDLEQKETGSKILNIWYSWERSLRNKLVHLRAKQLKMDPEEFIKPNIDPLSGEHITREAFEHESPLSAEDILNWSRWSYLEELELGHHFDLEKILVYYLKLQILQRKESFNKERGTDKFNDMIEKISKEDFSKQKEESDVIQ